MREERLVFVIPSEEHEAAAKEYVAEFERDGTHVNGSNGLGDLIGNYAGWLHLVQTLASGQNCEDRLAGPTYFAVRPSDGRIVGTVSTRARLDDEMFRTGGHVGYGVRPSERRKGYAVQMLEYALKALKNEGLDRVLVTCDTDNIGSAGVIRHCGGVFENEEDDDGTPVSRYFISV